jgi:hypothetical protein
MQPAVPNVFVGQGAPMRATQYVGAPHRTATGESAWRWIAMAFSLYWVCFAVGAYSGNRALNNVGAAIVLATLGGLALERLWVELDAVAMASVAAAVLAVMVTFVSGAARHPDALVKYVSLYAVIALSRILRLPVASESGARWILAAQILTILAISATTDVGGVWDGGTRHSGLFANPNNLVLIPLLLLLLVSPRRDGKTLHVAAHLVVIAVLIYAQTSGAVLAYGIGLVWLLGGKVGRPWKLFFITLISVTALALVAVVAFVDESALPQTRLVSQLVVMRSELDTALSGAPVAYYEHERELGPGAASGAWRLAHWRKAIAIYAEGSVAERVLGFGTGSSPDYLGKLPHNEYLRMLFEQGFAGLVLFLIAWGGLVKSAKPQIRYCGLILAIYSLSENNLDNFPFMSLFVLCSSARGAAGDPAA